jgi:hypothetical protein
MRSSYIATIAPDSLTNESGYVLLGTIDGLAYVHFSATRAPQTVVFRNGDLTNPQPDGEGMVGVFEFPRPSFEAQAEVLFDPTPLPFHWADFAAEFPELAESPGDDEDGNPLPSPLMPHQWAGE